MILVHYVIRYIESLKGSANISDALDFFVIAGTTCTCILMIGSNIKSMYFSEC